MTVFDRFDVDQRQVDYANNLFIVHCIRTW